MTPRHIEKDYTKIRLRVWKCRIDLTTHDTEQ